MNEKQSINGLIRWVLSEEAKRTDMTPEQRVRLLIQVLTEYLRRNK